LIEKRPKSIDYFGHAEGSQAGLEKVLREAYKEVNPDRFKSINESPASG